MARRRDVASTIRALLTGQTTSNNSGAVRDFLLGNTSKYSNTFGGGLEGLATSTAPKITGYAPGMRRGSSVLDPSTGKVLGLGPNIEAPPTFSGTSNHPTSSHKVGSGVTLGDLNKAAIAAISAQYDPAIGTITNQIHHTKHAGNKEQRQIKRRGNRAVGDLSILYGRLGRYTKRVQHRQNNAYKRDIKGTRRNYHDLQQQTASDFNATAGSTAAELKHLGIDPSVALQGAAQDRAFVNAENRRDRRNQVQNIKSSKHGTNIMMNRLHNDVLASGLAAVGQSKAQTEAGLQEAARQIADQMFQLRMQRSSLQGQEAGALAGQRANFLQQKYTSKAAKQAARLDNLYKRAQIAHLMGQGAGTASSVDITGNLGKGLNFLEKNPTAHTAGLENLLEYVTGGHNFKDSSKTSYQWRKEDINPIWAAMQRTGARHKWSTQEMNYLRRALEISLGL